MQKTSSESRVSEEVEKNRKKDQMIAHQARLAAMGEMIGAIAHQWRQPLNALALIIQDMSDIKTSDGSEQQRVYEYIEQGMNYIQFMSKTIEDFKNFFRINKRKISFDMKVATASVLLMISEQFRLNYIVCRITCHAHNRTFVDITDVHRCEDFVVDSYENEFKHVILNLVSNAKDAILEGRSRGLKGISEQGHIDIDFEMIKGKKVIRISDDGIGIKEDIIEKIFDPYFSTKDSDKVTGIGLYIAKMIVQDNMGGRLSARDTGKGAEFIIEL